MQLSVIILSFNTRQLLADCLQSLFRETKKTKFEVIVVDNNSQDGSPKMVKEKFPQVNLITLGKNYGFGKANNLGAEKAKVDWLLFLNSDTQILKGAIDKIFSYVRDMGSKAEEAVFGCQLLNADGSIQPSAGFFPTLSRVAMQMFFLDDLPILKNLVRPYQQNHLPFYRQEQAVDWVTGAFLLLKRDFFNKVKGFDEQIFMYAEEIDLCYRLKQMGADVKYTPIAQITHLKGGSSKDGFTAAVLGEYKGLISFFKKHRPLWQLPILKLLLGVGSLLRLGLFGMIDRKKVKAYVKSFQTLN